MKKITPLTVLVLAGTLWFTPSASAHEGNEAEGAHAEWLFRVLIIGGLAVVSVGIYTMQRR